MNSNFPNASFFFAALLLSEGLGNLHPPTARILAWFLLAIPALREGPPLANLRRAGLAVVLASGAFVLSCRDGGLAAFALPAWLIAWGVGVKIDGERKAQMGYRLAWSFSFSAIALIYHQDPTVRLVIEEHAIGIGATISSLLDKPWAPASTAGGFLVALAYTTAVIAALPGVRPGGRVRVFLLGLAGLGVSLAIYAYLSSTLNDLYQNTAHYATLPDPGDASHAGQHSADPFRWVSPLAALFPMSHQLFLAALLYVVGRRVTSEVQPQEATAATTPVVGILLGACLGLGIAAAFWIWSPPAAFAPLKGLRVQVHKKYIDWERPRQGAYGDRSGGMFGMLEDHLRARGCIVTSEPLSSLENQDILILVNLQERFSEPEKVEIRKFVLRGGGLLIAGDHTGLTGLREPANDLVKDLGIEFNFDTAKPLARGWANGLEFLAHPVTRNLPWWVNESSIWVGASLTVRAPAYPLVLGRYAYVDQGDQTSERGKLGDMKYAAGERLGDVPLVAAREYGRGKVIVWGDTSPLQNGAWTFSHRYMERTLAWLGRPGGGILDRCRPVAGLILMIAAIAISVLPARWSHKALVMGIFAFGSASIAAYGEHQSPQPSIGPGQRAYIDAADLPAVNMNYWLRDGFGGLSQHLSRCGMLSYLLWDWDRSEWGDASLIILLAPSREISQVNRDRLARFVEGGGHLLIAAGWEEVTPVQPLLDSFGLRVENSPLGQVAGVCWRGRPIQFVNTWPVVVNPASARSCEVLAKVGDASCVVRCQRGKGSVTLIGDSRFLRNANTEGRTEMVPENLEFIRALVQEKLLLGNAPALPSTPAEPRKGL